MCWEKRKFLRWLIKKKAEANNIDLKEAFGKSDTLIARAKRNNKDAEYNVSMTLDSVLTPAQYETLKAKAIVKPSYPEFMGFKLKNVYNFFMLFVVLCGLAGLILYSLTPMMKKMMHGVR